MKMSKYNKKGEEIVDMQLDAADKYEDRDVVFIASDQMRELIELLTELRTELRQIKLHLASATEENITDKDAD